MCSCGLKITSQVNENVLNGSWQMDSIECFTNLTTEALPREVYTLSGVVDIDATLIIDASNVNYLVTTDNCTSSATASLKTVFDNDLQDTLDFKNILSAGTCNESLSFGVPSGGFGMGTVKFTMLSIDSKDLSWEVNSDKDELTLQLFTGFTGSNTAGFCDENCTCYANFSEI